MSRRRDRTGVDVPHWTEQMGIGHVRVHCARCNKLLIKYGAENSDPQGGGRLDEWWDTIVPTPVSVGANASRKLHPHCPCGARPQVLLSTLAKHAVPGSTRRVAF